ncbi:MAG: hypothetical protein KDB80_07535, partial [Planctomycetes bacterium]|nr:hypothetical protein [Planctomycetota bacterium]
MLTIHVCQSTIGMLRRRTVQVPWTGASFRQILAKHRDPAWSDGAPISVISGCAMVDELDVCPPDGAHIVIAPTPGVFESAIANFFAAFLISTALNIAISYLTAPDLSEIDATDESSPTYGFSGIHTSYGTGFRVPVVFGRHAVGGQMVSIESTPLNPDTNAETLKMVLALSEGPIYSIGGVKQDLDLAVPESANSLFPQGILVNDVALQADEPSAGNLGGLRISTRLGNEWQTPMRGFEEPRSTIAVGAELEDAGDSHVVFISGTESTVARAEVSFPQGLYRQDPSGVAPVDPNGYDARFTVKVRGVPSSIPWSAIQGIEREVETGPVGRREALAIGVEMRLDTAAPSSGLQTGYEIRVERTSAAHADTAQEVYSEGMVFNRVVHGTDNAIAYVRRAVMGVHMRGTERFQGNRPNVLTPVEGQLVRVWDSVHGVSTKRYYDLPESGDTFHGIWSYQPGRNPGWAAVEYIRADTMIRNYIAGPGGDIDIHIDWPAFRNLADYCDQSTAFAQPKWKAAEFVDPSTGSDVAKPDPSSGSLDCVLYPPGSSATASDAISGQLLALRTVGDEAQHSLQFDVSGALTGWHVRVDTDGLGTYAYG